MSTKKKKFQIEFEVRSSPRILFNYLSTPSGLADWFADEVKDDENIYTLFWGKSSSQVELLSKKDHHIVRYKWVDGDKDTYFEFEIVTDDLTSDVALLVTDFAEENDIEEETKLWQSQIGNLMHIIGS
jgi:uncharacterized protein YndB with AHSA1/START domain